MDSRILTNYIDRIFRFALGKTFSEDEAEELTQEILMNAITSLGRLREEEKFEPWLWALAANTARNFRRGKSKQRAMFVYAAGVRPCYRCTPSDPFGGKRRGLLTRFSKPSK